MGISRERVGSIIHEDLEIRKLSAKCVPKCLSAYQKRQRCQSSEQFFRRDPIDSLSRLVTIEGTWLYHYEQETKQQSMELWHTGSLRPQKFRVQKSTRKVLASNFWDQDGILLIDYLPKAQTINALYYSSLLVQLNDILKEITPREGHPLLHDNAPGHRALATQKKLAYLGFRCLDYPPYSPAEVIAAAETWLDGQHSEVFFF